MPSIFVLPTQTVVADGDIIPYGKDPAGTATASKITALNIRKYVSVFVNVKDYGAKGNGTTDDTAAIQAAITAVVAAGGGAVFFPAGTYPVSYSISVGSNVSLLGVGPASTIKDVTGNLTIIALLDSVSDATIADLRFTGQGALGTAGRGAIWAQGNNSRLSVARCRFDHLGTCGVSFTGVTNSTIVNNWVLGGAEHGIYISDGSADVLVSGNHVINAGSDGGVSSVVGIKIAGCTRCLFSNNHIAGGITDGIMIDRSTTDIYVSGGSIVNPGNRCLRVVSGGPVTVDNVLLVNTSVSSGEAIYDTAGTKTIIKNCTISTAYNAIALTEASANAVIEGNRFVAWDTSDWAIRNYSDNALIKGNDIAPQAYGIYIGGTADGTRVEQNNNRATTQLSDNGTNTKIDPTVVSVIATASLPAASAAMNGRVVIEDNGTGDRNLVIYGGGQRFRIDGGAAF